MTSIGNSIPTARAQRALGRLFGADAETSAPPTGRQAPATRAFASVLSVCDYTGVIRAWRNVGQMDVRETAAKVTKPP